MSRALNVDAPREHVLATCAKLRLSYTQLESLVSGGTRVVLLNTDDAARVGKAYKGKIIDGLVTRVPTRTKYA